MAQQNRTTIKTFFETGDIPTEAQFGDSFDSQVFWVDDVETTLGTTDTKVPTSKAVNDTIVYTKDSNANVFYKGVTATLGAGSVRNIFQARATTNVLGVSCNHNNFEQDASGFTFGDNLRNVTIKSGSVGANYTAGGYSFLYAKDYSSEIFRNPENTANYHRYYDPTNDRIVLTLLQSPFTVSYIGGGGGGGDVYLANDQTFTGENTFAIGSGSKEPIIVTKGGNGAGIKVTKSSGSGDAIEVAQGSLSIADETASRIASFDGSKRIKSLATSTYPSLTELAYVKGVTSAIQTQLDSKTDTFAYFCSIGTWSSPADSTTYYAPIAGAVGSPLTTITTFLSSFNFACKIVGIFVQHLNNGGTQGSSQNVAIQLRNHTTPSSTQLINIQTNQASGVQKNFEDYSLNVAIAANDSIALQINTPTWSPDPTNIVLRINLLFQRT
jgi:hypothetical protein